MLKQISIAHNLFLIVCFFTQKTAKMLKRFLFLWYKIMTNFVHVTNNKPVFQG